MRDEDSLRAALRGGGGDGGSHDGRGGGAATIDTERVLRRVRSRRTLRTAAVTGAAALAVLGAAVVTLPGAGGTGGGVTSADAPMTESAPESDTSGGGGSGPGALSADGGDAAAGGGIALAPAYTINLCGGAAADGTLLEEGPLALAVSFPETAGLAAAVRGEVTITNISGDRLRGTTTDEAALTLARDGTVVWHTPALQGDVPLDLAPGESAALPATFEPRVCEPVDDADGFREDLPSAPAGGYQLIAAIDVTLPDGTVLQVLSDPTAITLG